MPHRFRLLVFTVDANISGTESAKALPFAANAHALTFLPALSKATALNRTSNSHHAANSFAPRYKTSPR